MKKTILLYLLLVTVLLLNVSCGESDPADWSGDNDKGDAGTDDAGSKDTDDVIDLSVCEGFWQCGDTSVDNSGSTDYFPLVDGAEWSYHHFGGLDGSTGEKDATCENIELEQTTYEDGPAFIVQDTPSRFCKVTKSVYVEFDGAVRRVHKDEYNPSGDCNQPLPKCEDSNELYEDADLGESCLSVNYEPGFTRFNKAWLDLAVGEGVSYTYDRTVTAARTLGADPVGAAYDRWHTYTVEAKGETVTVPAGTFKNCLRIRRVRNRDKEARETKVELADDKLFWFCPGVGKVREEEARQADETPRTEVLTYYCIPGGLCCR